MQLYNEGGHISTELAELLHVGRPTVYRSLYAARRQQKIADGAVTASATLMPRTCRRCTRTCSVTCMSDGR